MDRQAKIYIYGVEAGELLETDSGYTFQYSDDYLARKEAVSVSLTMPLRKEPFNSKTMFPFFDGLIPEGWLLDIVHKTWKLDLRDRMGLLLACCGDCIGAVSVKPSGAVKQ